MLVLLVPVIFAFMGFAIDLGQLYMARAELKAAANSMALGAAAQLIGTDTSTDNATAAAQLLLTESGGLSNRYYYGGLAIGESAGSGSSSAEEPEYYETVAAAIGAGEGGQSAGPAASRHVRIILQGDAPLTFWRFLPFVNEPRVPLRVEAVAGISAPLCVACGIEPVAVAALDAADETDFGFTVGGLYTFGYMCSGPGTPPVLPGTTQRIAYLMLNRYDQEAAVFTEESTQAFRIGAAGLPNSTSEAVSCLTVNAVETVWESAVAPNCNAVSPPAAVTAFVCGLAARFETGSVPAGCASIAEVDTVTAGLVADPDPASVESYEAYTGNGRRIITIPIVDSLGDPNAITVLGFRQFLVMPNADSTGLNATDQNGRFPAMYIGSAAPVKQGRMSGCTIAAGPGKVVLHK
jgi:hypothetical protein